MEQGPSDHGGVAEMKHSGLAINYINLCYAESVLLVMVIGEQSP